MAEFDQGMTMSPSLTDEEIQRDTQAWLEKAVIGLNLCPFAKSVHVNQRLRYVVTRASEPAAMLKELARELLALNRADPAEVETTLLIHPFVLGDFLDFNEFLGAADALIDELELAGELQIANFHPAYQFAGTEPDDITNCTNRSPYPTLHLLRESSIERAVATMEDTDAIVSANIDMLRRMGREGWEALGLK